MSLWAIVCPPLPGLALPTAGDHTFFPVTVPGPAAGVGAGAVLCGRAAAHQQEPGRIGEESGWGPSKTDDTADEAAFKV